MDKWIAEIPKEPWFEPKVKTTGGKYIACVLGTKKDARLIAAAPDLLEACRAAIKQADEYAEMDRDVPSFGAGNPFDAIRAAIVKAKRGR